ncbi:hypothetical protein JCM12296A_24230 [Desulfosarcina cetonica]
MYIQIEGKVNRRAVWRELLLRKTGVPMAVLAVYATVPHGRPRSDKFKDDDFIFCQKLTTVCVI